MLRKYRQFCTQVFDKKLLAKLQRLSALKMTEQDLKNLEEDIRIAQKIFEVDTSDMTVKALYNVSEDHIECPLRGNSIEPTPKDEVFTNAKKVYEDFFVAPTVGLIKEDIKNGDSENKI